MHRGIVIYRLHVLIIVVSIIVGFSFIIIGDMSSLSGQSLEEYDQLPTNKVVVRVDGNRTAYSNPIINVSAGAPIRMIFVNSARLKMHNWVMAKNTVKAIDLAQASRLTSGSSENYLPEEALFHAATPLVPPRSRVTINFDAPQIPGRYVFLCTVPGHFEGGMSGVMIVSG